MATCIKCQQDHDRSSRQSYCRSCHAAYMRAWRELHPMTPEQRARDRCRSYANVYLQRGKIRRRPCEICARPAEMHHDDYTKPLSVRWFCRKHHQELHRCLK